MTRIPTRIALRRTLKAFDELCAELGEAPSIREVSVRLGMQHPLGAQKTLNNAIRRGLILTKPRIIREPERLSAAGRKWLQEAEQEEVNQNG